MEFALILPTFVVLLFLIFEVGRLFGSWLLITHAAREGARLASACMSATSVCISNAGSQVQSTAQFLVVDPAVNCASNQIPSGKSSCVKVVYCQSGGTNDGICPQDSTGDNFYVVLVEYQVQTLMPINGKWVPFLGTINYPGFVQVTGLSTMRAE